MSICVLFISWINEDFKMADINADELQQIIDELQSKFGFVDKRLSDFAKNLKKNGANVDDALKALAKQVKKGTDTYDDHIRTIDQLDNALDELTDSAEDAVKRRELLDIRDATKQKAIAKGLEEAVTKSTTEIVQTTGKMASATIKGVGAFVNGLQNNANSNQLATGIFNAGIDIAETGISGFGKAASGLAPMLTMLGPYGIAAGAALGLVGAAASTAAPAMAKLAKFGVEVLSKEVEKTIESFNKMSSSGAMFTDGMTGMRKSAGQAGLTVDQFSNVIKNNSGTIAASGLGMTEGAKKIGGALSVGGTKMKTSLLNLGYGFEEQAALVADTIKDMRGSKVGPLTASNQKIAEQTQKYAENLRIIAAITGEDAKKKSEQVRNEANILAFQQKLAAMPAAQQAATMRAMDNMNSLQRKNFMDMVNFGSIINTEGAAASALSVGLRDSVSDAYKMWQQGKLDDVNQRTLNAKYNAQMQKDALGQTSIGLAGAAGVGGLPQALAESFMTMINEVKTGTPEAIAAAEKNMKAQEKTSDALTKSVTGAAEAAQNLKLVLQDVLTPAIGKFAEVSEAMLTSVQEMLADLGLGTAPKSAKSLPTFMPGQGKGILSDLGFAKGGISSGPLSGYTEKLHGTEAVVPLPDGKTIPVTMDSSSITNSIQQQNGILNGILEALHKNNQLTSGILQSSY